MFTQIHFPSSNFIMVRAFVSSHGIIDTGNIENIPVINLSRFCTAFVFYYFAGQQRLEEILVREGFFSKRKSLKDVPRQPFFFFIGK